MPFVKTPIEGLLVFEPAVFEDSRGYFFESYNESIFKKEGIDINWVQDNQSSSGYGVIRGLHFQSPPYAQAKLVRVLTGEILDVAVDIRRGSPTYAQVYTLKLSGDNRKQLFIPPGFAHGFSVLSERAEVLYKCNQFYNKQSEGGIMYNDPVLKIDWQIRKDEEIISEKDSVLPTLENCNHNFVYSS